MRASGQHHPTRTRFGPYRLLDPHPHLTCFKPHESVDGSFVYSNCGDEMPFRPVIFGEVKEILHKADPEGQRDKYNVGSLNLGLPKYASQLVDTFFWNQLAELDDGVKRDSAYNESDAHMLPFGDYIQHGYLIVVNDRPSGTFGFRDFSTSSPVCNWRSISVGAFVVLVGDLLRVDYPHNNSCVRSVRSLRLFGSEVVGVSIDVSQEKIRRRPPRAPPHIPGSRVSTENVLSGDALAGSSTDAFARRSDSVETPMLRQKHGLSASVISCGVNSLLGLTEADAMLPVYMREILEIPQKYAH
ncbi:hypothetical protein B0H13DRAFT_1859344 [Mycena leptocephala]|nr:hypothetical protein B0H13DRAFT_1859344 [Mycena leptocephala]